MTMLRAWDTRMGEPIKVQSKRYRLSVRNPSIQARPRPYHRK